MESAKGMIACRESYVDFSAVSLMSMKMKHVSLITFCGTGHLIKNCMRRTDELIYPCEKNVARMGFRKLCGSRIG